MINALEVLLSANVPSGVYSHCFGKEVWVYDMVSNVGVFCPLSSLEIVRVAHSRG